MTTRDAVRLLPLLFAFLLPGSAQTPASKLDEIQKLIDAKDWKAAITAADALTTAEPNSPAAWVKRGLAYQGEGDSRGALDSYLQAEKLGATPMTLAFREAAAYARLGENQKALDLLDQAEKNGMILGDRLQDPDLGSIRGDPRFAAITAQDAKNQHPCSDAGYRQFDFWVGEWDVRTLDGTKVGDSRIQRILNDCVILETWNPGKGVREGQSFNSYNTTTGKWTQFWVDAQGSNTQYVDGEYKDNALRFWGHNPDPAGKPVLQRFTFFDLGPDKVRQFQEQSIDDGKNWTTVYDFYYFRKTGS